MELSSQHDLYEAGFRLFISGPAKSGSNNDRSMPREGKKGINAERMNGLRSFLGHDVGLLPDHPFTSPNPQA